MLQVLGLLGVGVGVGFAVTDGVADGVAVGVTLDVAVGLGTGVGLGVAEFAGCVSDSTKAAAANRAQRLVTGWFIQSKIVARARFAGQAEALRRKLQVLARLSRQMLRLHRPRREPRIPA